MNVNLMNYIKLKGSLTEVEKDVLLLELACAYISKGKSNLFEFIMNGDYSEFKKLYSHMDKEGKKIKSDLEKAQKSVKK